MIKNNSQKVSKWYNFSIVKIKKIAEAIEPIFQKTEKLFILSIK